MLAIELTGYDETYSSTIQNLLQYARHRASEGLIRKISNLRIINIVRLSLKKLERGGREKGREGGKKGRRRKERGKR